MMGVRIPPGLPFKFINKVVIIHVGLIMKDNQKNKKGTRKENESMTDKNKSTAFSNESSKDRKKGQQLPAKKSSENKQKKKSEKFNIIKISSQFLKDARTELKKVKWPTRKELTAATIMVVILVLIVAFISGW